MNTEGKDFQYGIIEASIQVPNTTNQGSGPHSGHWAVTSLLFPGLPAVKLTSWKTGQRQVDSGPGIAGIRSTIHTALTGGYGVGSLYSFPAAKRQTLASTPMNYLDCERDAVLRR